MSFEVLEHEPLMVDPNLYAAFGGGSSLGAVAPEIKEGLPEQSRAVLLATAADYGGGTKAVRDALNTIGLGDARSVMTALAQGNTSELFGLRLGEGATLEDVNEVCAMLYAQMEVAKTANDTAKYLLDTTAASVGEAVMRQAGELRGQVVGNLILGRLMASPEKGGEGIGPDESLRVVSDWLGIDPAVQVKLTSHDTHHIIMETTDGKVYPNEGVIDPVHIDEPTKMKLWAELLDGGEVTMSATAREELANAAVVANAGGSVATTMLAHLCLPGMPDVLAENKRRGGIFASMTNMEVGPDTAGFRNLGEYAQVIETAAQRLLDVLIVNRNVEGIRNGRRALFAEEISKLALLQDELGMSYIPAEFSGIGRAVIVADLLSDRGESINPTDAVALAGLRSGSKTSGAAFGRALTIARTIPVEHRMLMEMSA